MSGLSASDFDAWYDTIAASGARDAFMRRHLGLPADLESTGVLPECGLLEVQEQLGLTGDDLLVELGCGRGGYGLAAVREVGARLVGIDFSASAVRLANASAVRLGLSERAEFHRGDLAAVPLPSGIADAILCVDAIQFAAPPAAALLECGRLLKPGGRLVITTWAAVDPSAADRLPDRLARMDVRADLHATGFVGVEVASRPRWSSIEEGLWSAAARIEPEGDPAMASLRSEALDLLPILPLLQRQLATASSSGHGGN